MIAWLRIAYEKAVSHEPRHRARMTTFPKKRLSELLCGSVILKKGHKYRMVMIIFNNINNNNIRSTIKINVLTISRKLNNRNINHLTFA